MVVTAAKGILWAKPNLIIDITPRYQNQPAKGQHLTLQFGVELQGFYSIWLGHTFTAQTLYEAWDGKIQAIAVELPSEVRHLCRNTYPHITVSWVDGMEPYHSNRMLSSAFNYRLLNRVIDFEIEFLVW